MHMKIGLVQMPVTDDKAQNLVFAASSVRKCAADGAELVVLPEMFICPYSNEHFLLFAEPENGQSYTFLAGVARENAVYLIAGSVPELCGNAVFNTSYVFNPRGQRIARHRKMHLFDIDVKEGQSFKESDVLSAGGDITLFEANSVTLGLCICFDMRFHELCGLMAQKGAQAIIAPAAFNMTTGPAHWELLFRQRAVDNQLFTVGVAPARNENGPYVSYGNSIAVSPWGDVLFRADEKAVSHVIDLDFDKNAEIRAQLPILSARRRDIYSLELI